MKRQLLVEVPVDHVQAAEASVIRRIARGLRVPGFRPGKAPGRVVREQRAEEIRRETQHALISQALTEALRRAGVTPLEPPDVREVRFAPDQPFTFAAVFETLPELPAFDYGALQLPPDEPADVTDEAVAARLAALARERSVPAPVPRAARAGDVVRLDVTRRVLGGESPAESHQDVAVELGAPHNPPGFDEQVCGLSAGDRKAFTLRFPADYAAPMLRGADIDYVVRVREVVEMAPPPLDDALAAALGMASVEALRAETRERLREEAHLAYVQRARASLVEQLAAQVGIDAPEGLLARELDRRVAEHGQRLLDAGIDLGTARPDWDAFRAAQRADAIVAVKGTIALDVIAAREQIEADSALHTEIAHRARAAGRDVRQMRAELERTGALPRLAAGIRRNLTLDWLIETIGTR